MLPIGSIVSDGATLVGFMAGVIVVGGFLAHARPVLQGRDEQEIRIATVVGGLMGIAVASIATVIAGFR